jgi:formylglycine-generating enzyme required for sulfatase activity
MFTARVYLAGPVSLALFVAGGLSPLPAQPAKDAKAITNSIGMKLVHIPAGKFLMGSPKEEKDRADNEEQHEVVITKPFYMGVYAVTQAEYVHVMDQNPSWFCAQGNGKASVAGIDTSRFPVEQVMWDDAVAFCKELSQLPEEKKAGRIYRLPTEAEWEYACRAGTTTPCHYGNSLSSKQANFYGDCPYCGAEKGPFLNRPTKVGSYLPNDFGLYDMHGNVWQWCLDWYDPKYYENGVRRDPAGPEVGSFHVFRGGGWSNTGLDCRSAIRGRVKPPVAGSQSLGFRVVAVQSSR